MYFSLDAAHTSGGHGWPASTTLLKKNSESQPWTLDGRAPPADITTHRLRIAPSMAFFKRISGGRGRLRLPRALPPSPPSGRLQHTASPGTASEGSSRRGDFTLFFRADARPAGAGGSRTGDPSKKTGDGTFATPARTRPKREAARGGRGAEKVGRAVGCGPPPPGPGRVRTAELATARAPATDAGSARRGPTMAGPVSAVDARGIVGPPDARAARESDAAPNLWRAASRGAGRCDRAADALGRPSHGASRALAGLGALTGPKRWLCARAAPALAERSVAQGF